MMNAYLLAIKALSIGSFSGGRGTAYPPPGFIASAMSSSAKFSCKGILALCCGMASRMRFSRLLVAPIARGVWGLVGDENRLQISVQKNCTSYRSCSVVAYSSEGPMRDWVKGYGGRLSKWCHNCLNNYEMLRV